MAGLLNDMVPIRAYPRARAFQIPNISMPITEGCGFFSMLSVVRNNDLSR